jgi:hypothetical protein
MLVETLKSTRNERTHKGLHLSKQAYDTLHAALPEQLLLSQLCANCVITQTQQFNALMVGIVSLRPSQ